ncbi:hypothetical protein ACIBJI_16345 [Nocardia sp. NPDC050408]|uniref:hypothetical protein n=1 Tax=Nocardia sp. NPDC050408 TaxID=3364319 RepID=UPI0037B92F7F
MIAVTLSVYVPAYRFQRRIANDYPDLVHRGDVLAGDARLAEPALHRLRVRRVATVRNRSDLLV